MNKPIIEAKGISLYYQKKAALNSIDVSFQSQTLTAIIGPNGAGKSTLIHVLAGLLTPNSGTVLIKNKNILKYESREIARTRAVLLQKNNISFPYTVLETVSMGRIPYIGSNLNYSKQDKQIINKFINLLELTELSDRKFQALSGGEQQRVLLARALIQEPSILFLDEPLNSLDLRHQILIIKFLKQLIQSTHMTVIAVFHNLNTVSEFCDQVVLMKEGQIMGQGKPSQLFKFSLLQEIFGVDIYIGINEMTGNLFIHPFDAK